MPLTIQEGADGARQVSFPQPSMQPLPSAPDQDFFRFRIESQDILEELQHQLRGEVWSPKTQKYEKMFDAWMNDEGISRVLHVAYSCGLNKNTFLGCLTHEEISYKCNKLKKGLSRVIAIKYQDYNIKKEMKTLIIESIKNQIHSGLSRCEDGREADQLSTATQRHELIQHENKKQSGGSILNPMTWGKR
jgi:hypothetical protein